MFTRLKKLLAAIAGLAALAAGGAVYADAQSSTAPAKAPAAETTSASDPADAPGAADTENGADKADIEKADGAGDKADAPDGPGDKADAPDANEAPGSESAADGDGPGGHADETGNAGAQQ